MRSAAPVWPRSLWFARLCTRRQSRQPAASGSPESPVPSSTRSRPRLLGRGPLGHIPGIGVWGPSGPTHSLGRRPAAATAPRGLLASLQARLATPVPGCTGLIKESSARGEPGTRASPPRKGGRTASPSPRFPPNLPVSPPPLSTPPEPCARGSLAPRARRSVKSGDLWAPGGWSVERPPGGHFPTSWGLARLLRVWES